MSDGEFHKRSTLVRPMSSVRFVKMEDIEQAKKEIFPLPTGDIIFNPATNARDKILLDMKDWLPLINKLRKWFGPP